MTRENPIKQLNEWKIILTISNRLKEKILKVKYFKNFNTKAKLYSAGDFAHIPLRRQLHTGQDKTQNRYGKVLPKLWSINISYV